MSPGGRGTARVHAKVDTGPDPFSLVALPPGPPSSHEPITPSRLARRCSSCTSPLEALGPRNFRTGDSEAGEGVLVLEMFWCPHCGKVEFFSVR